MHESWLASTWAFVRGELPDAPATVFEIGCGPDGGFVPQLLAAGYDADFTVVDLRRQRMIRNDWIVSPCGWTPFDGQVCTGWPVMTVVRGQVAMRDDEVVGAPRGTGVRFLDTLRA